VNDGLLSQDVLLAIIAVQQEIVETDLSLDHVMNVVARAARRLTGSDAAVVELSEGDEMVYRAAAGVARQYVGLRLSAASLSGLCVRLNQPLRCDDCMIDDRVDRGACERVGARSLIVVPLLYRGSPLGVLKIYSSRPNAFDDRSAEVLRLLVGIISASMQRAREHEHLTRRAHHDELTGLVKREQLEIVMEEKIRHDAPFAFVFVDLNDFKRINDDHGHGRGDEILRAVGGRLSSSLRTGDVAARFGGDEFALLLDGSESAAAAQVPVHRLLQHISAPVCCDDGTLCISASAGVALFPKDGESVAELIRVADGRMYEAKRERRAGV